MLKLHVHVIPEPEPTCPCGQPLDRDPNDQPYCRKCDGDQWGDNGGLPMISELAA